MSLVRPLLLLGLAMLAVLAPPVQAMGDATARASESCSTESCCCGPSDGPSGPAAEPMQGCPCAAPTPAPTPAPSVAESRTESAADPSQELADPPCVGTLPEVTARAVFRAAPPAPPPVRDLLGVRLL